MFPLEDCANAMLAARACVNDPLEPLGATLSRCCSAATGVAFKCTGHDTYNRMRSNVYQDDGMLTIHVPNVPVFRFEGIKYDAETSTQIPVASNAVDSESTLQDIADGFVSVLREVWSPMLVPYTVAAVALLPNPQGPYEVHVFGLPYTNHIYNNNLFVRECSAGMGWH